MKILKYNDFLNESLSNEEQRAFDMIKKAYEIAVPPIVNRGKYIDFKGNERDIYGDDYLDFKITYEDKKVYYEPRNKRKIEIFEINDKGRDKK